MSKKERSKKQLTESAYGNVHVQNFAILAENLAEVTFVDVLGEPLDDNLRID